jgi:hypothetical protein
MIALSLLVVAAFVGSTPPSAPLPDDPEGAFQAWADREQVELSRIACDVDAGAVICYGLDRYRSPLAAEWVDGDFSLVLPIEPDTRGDEVEPSEPAGEPPSPVSAEVQQVLLECAGAVGLPATLVDALASGDPADFDNAVTVCGQVEATLAAATSPDPIALNLVRAVIDELDSIATDHAAGLDVSSTSAGGGAHVDALSEAWRALAEIVVG